MTTGAQDPELGTAGSRQLVQAVAAFLVVAGAGLAVLRFVGGSPVEQGLEGALGALALGAVVMAAGVLALLALRDRAVLLLPAAVLLVPMSFVSFSLVTLPLLVPAAMLCIGYGRRSRRDPMPVARVGLTLFVVVLLMLAALAALFLHQDPREYTSPSSSGGTSDIITTTEALISLALTAASLTAGWVLSAPRSPAIP